MEPWGDDWQQTAFIASALAGTKPGKDYKALIPRAFPDAMTTEKETIDPESFFRRLTRGLGG